MFNPNQPVIDAFVSSTLMRFEDAYPDGEAKHFRVLEQSARMALETLLSCDCPYHDLHHTILVTDVGQTILQGRLISEGDVFEVEWLHAVIAMLYHDIGFVRGLLKEDSDNSYVTDEDGSRIMLPQGATDVHLSAYHVSRGCLYVAERFGNDPVLDAKVLAEHIELTRFPIPTDPMYQRLDSMSAVVRAADLIGQMGEPMYLQKLSRLFAEFRETGDAERMGFANAGELRAGFPEFFYDYVYPYVTEGLRYLRKTQDGQQWIASLFHHLHCAQEVEPAWRPERLLSGVEDVLPETSSKPSNLHVLGNRS